MGPVDVVNIALMEIGSQSTISSFTEGSTEANVASLLYQPKIDALHRAAHWNFSRKQVALTQLKASIIGSAVSTNPPPVPWLYEYAYPVDCLKARFVFPQPPPPSGTAPPLMGGVQSVMPYYTGMFPVNYVVGQDVDANGVPIRVILTNAPLAQLVYTARVTNVDMWDPHFLSAASSTLGAWFVNALARNTALMKDQVALASNIIQQARVSDGNEGFTSTDHAPDWIRIRSFQYDWTDPSDYVSTWDAMSFPDGAWC